LPARNVASPLPPDEDPSAAQHRALSARARIPNPNRQGSSKLMTYEPAAARWPQAIATSDIQSLRRRHQESHQQGNSSLFSHEPAREIFADAFHRKPLGDQRCPVSSCAPFGRGVPGLTAA
jgi:hypothetical protein